MQGLMQDFPLTLPHFFDRAKYLFPEKEIVTATATGIERTNYGEWADRTQRLGGVLDDLGISEDGRVATFGWNTLATSSSTSPPRARAGSCTRSTSACFPSS